MYSIHFYQVIYTHDISLQVMWYYIIVCCSVCVFVRLMLFANTQLEYAWIHLRLYTNNLDRNICIAYSKYCIAYILKVRITKQLCCQVSLSCDCGVTIKLIYVTLLCRVRTDIKSILKLTFSQINKLITSTTHPIDIKIIGSMLSSFSKNKAQRIKLTYKRLNLILEIHDLSIKTFQKPYRTNKNRSYSDICIQIYAKGLSKNKKYN